jgi:hypothetical protein
VQLERKPSASVGELAKPFAIKLLTLVRRIKAEGRPLSRAFPYARHGCSGEYPGVVRPKWVVMSWRERGSADVN